MTTLPSSDIDRLNGLEAVYESNQRKFLALVKNKFSLVHPIGNGFIPGNAILAAPYADPLDIRGISFWRSFRKIFPGGKLSEELSEYIWPSSNENAIHVQFTSPVPDLPPLGQLKAVFSNNNEGSSDGRYCLAACNDGTVQWLPRSQCGNGGHIWTVHLFDVRPAEGKMHLCQKLKRRGPIAHNNYVNVINNNNFGENRNESGTQNIGTINSQTDVNLLCDPKN
ncbi:uncharacterized protein LOC141656158 [Silene latifolia]|uniref:uncharacterized protein LOC141656158 n=1 Tax=Silene latifolia TaxID=37657 RepID=UPI003D77519C